MRPDHDEHFRRSGSVTSTDHQQARCHTNENPRQKQACIAPASARLSLRTRTLHACLSLQWKNKRVQSQVSYYVPLTVLLSSGATCVKINAPWLCDCRNKITRTSSESSSWILCARRKPLR